MGFLQELQVRQMDMWRRYPERRAVARARGIGGVVTDAPQLHWTEPEPRSARWRSENGAAPPARVGVADGALTPEAAWARVDGGAAILWRGDYVHARELLAAMGRIERRGGTPAPPAASPAEAFRAHRAAQARRALALGRLLVPVDGEHRVPLRRAPDLREALTEAWGPPDGGGCVVALRELLGVVGAHEWRRNGVEVAALRARIHPHYGVYSPVRGEYVDLVARAPLPAVARTRESVAFDIGTGTAVLAAVLARRGLMRVVATDLAPRAVACARDNVRRLGLTGRVHVREAAMFPDGRAALVVCNPPWVPESPTAAVEAGVYDPDSAMLRAFLGGLADHLAPGGEGWLILSDLAEHLGLRSRAELERWIAAGGLRVLDRLDTRPTHRKAADATDPLHAARAAEVTSLWRLAPA